MAQTKPNLNPSPISNLHGSSNSRFCSHFSFPRSPCSLPAPRSPFPVLVTSGKADNSFIYHHTLFSISQYLNRHFFNGEITVKPLLSDERIFFPLVTIAASPLKFRRKQQEKKNPLAPRVLLSLLRPLGGLFISSK